MKREIIVYRVAILVGIAIVLVIGTVSAHEFQFRRQSNLLVKQAEDLVQQGNKAGSIPFFQQYLNFHPKDGPVLEQYADIWEDITMPKDRNARIKRQDVQQYMEILERLLNLNDAPRYEKRVKLIELYLGNLDYSEAQRHLKQLEVAEEGKGGKKLYQDDAWLWEQLATCEIGLSVKNTSQAIKYLRSAIQCKSKPAKVETYARLAELLRKNATSKEMTQEADKVMDELILLNPESLDARLARTNYLLGIADKTPKQVQTLTEDAEILHRSNSSENANILFAVAKMDAESEKFDIARKLVAAGVKKFPDQPRFHHLYSYILLKQGERDLARAELITLVGQLSPANREFFQSLNTLIDLGETKAVADACVQFDAKPADRPFGDFLRGRLAVLSGDLPVAFSLAEASMQTIERTDGYKGYGHLLLSQCHELAGNPDMQFTEASAALQQNPTLTNAKILLARAQEKMGQLSKATEMYREISQTEPGFKPVLADMLLNEQLARDPSVRSWRELENLLGEKNPTPALIITRARLLYVQNRQEEAMRILEDAVAKNPKQVKLILALSELRSTCLNLKAGLDTLDEAQKSLGDTVEIRTARAVIMTRDPAMSTTPKLAAIGDKVDAFTPSDKHRLWSKIGEIFVSLGRPEDAIAFFRKAANLVPADIPSRLALFDIAFKTRKMDQAKAITEEIRGIEGQSGAHAAVLSAVVELETVDSISKARLVELRRMVEEAKVKKSGWSSLYYCLGEINRKLDHEDATLENFIRAIDLGDRNPILIRKTYTMLIQRHMFDRANTLATRVDRYAGIKNIRWDSAWGLVTSDPKAALSLLDPESLIPEDLVLRAKLLALTGELRDADASYRKALSQTKGRNPEIWVDFVRFLVAAGNGGDARKAYREAETILTPLAQGAEKAKVSLALGQCHEALGEAREAEELYRAAIAAGGDTNEAVLQLAGLYQRLNRRPEAEALYEGAIKTAVTDSVRRVFRRKLAHYKVSQPTGYRFLPEAIALIDKNIEEANQIDDRRAKALILAIDNSQIDQVKTLLLETSQKFPLTTEENFKLAQLSIAENEIAKAETYLMAATGSQNVQPEYLALLSQVQLMQDKTVQARATVEKLKLLAPTSWDAAAEEARLLSLSGSTDAAVKRILQHENARDPAMAVRTVGPFLEEIKAFRDAETVFKRPMTETKAPNRHTHLAGYYLRRGETEKAVEIAFSFAKMPEIPVEITCRILASAVFSRPRSRPDADGSWAKKQDEIRKYIREQAAKMPNAPFVRLADAELADVEGRYDDAVASYEAALALMPDYPALLNNYAVFLALNSKEKSNRPLELIERVIRNYGPSFANMDTRGLVHTAAGRYEDAIRDLKLAVKLSQNPVYRFHLAVAYDGAGKKSARDEMLRIAYAGNLTKERLNPREWPTFDRLMAPYIKR
ncbi:MAG: tetratricopeptide repeat protein [Gemmataceae bacterium]